MTVSDDEAEPSSRRSRQVPRRAALVVLVAVLLGAAGLWAVKGSGSSGDPAVATQAAAPTSDRTPPADDAAAPTTTAAPSTSTSTSPPTTPFKVGTKSASVDDIHASTEARPTHIRIGDIQVDAGVSPAGVAQDGSGELEVPEQADAVVWYQFGPSPGSPGSAVVAGHVDYDGAEGSFFHLRDLKPGAMITIDYDDGSQEQFRVTERKLVAKVALRTDDIFSRQGPPRLHVITCGGSFDSSARSYRDNVVVEALPVGP